MTPRRIRRELWRLLTDATRAERRWLKHPVGAALGPFDQLRRFSELVGKPWSALARPNPVHASYVIDQSKPPTMDNRRTVVLGAYRDGVPAQRAAAVRGSCLAPRPGWFQPGGVTVNDMPVIARRVEVTGT